MDVQALLALSGARVSNDEGRLRSARRWPWKKADALLLLDGLVRAYIDQAAALVKLGKVSDGRRSLAMAFERQWEWCEAAGQVNPDYQLVQALGAGLLSGAGDGTPELARRALATLELQNGIANTADRVELACADHGVGAVVAWIGGAGPAVVEREERLCGSLRGRLKQFRLWADCAVNGVHDDVIGLNESLETLAAFHKSAAEGNELKNSSDALLYLPGMLLVGFAQMKGMTVRVPSDEMWRPELLV